MTETTENPTIQPPTALSLSPEKERFLVELEFIQSLALPQYLTRLAQLKFFDDPAFINYLKYLQYWKKPQYAKFIVYPHCLHFLDLLQNEQFRQALKSEDLAMMAHAKQYYHIHAWRRLDVRNNRGPYDPLSPPILLPSKEPIAMNGTSNDQQSVNGFNMPNSPSELIDVDAVDGVANINVPNVLNSASAVTAHTTNMANGQL